MNAAQLKASILQQAIEGKLVPQLPEEGVVEQIGDAPTEVPFEIPASWKWVTIKNIVVPTKQKIPDKDFTYIDVSCISSFSVAQPKFISADKAPSRARKIVHPGMLLYATVRPYLKNICIAPEIQGDVIASTAFATFECKAIVYNRYLFYVLISDYMSSYAKSVQKGISYPAINDTDFYKTLIPLPPVSEQKRIVAKIEEIMPLVEEYGKAYDKLQELNDELPGKLKASILQEAIQGKLVPQLPEDGVVEQIGKAPAEVPFDIPSSWQWLSFSDLLIFENGDRGKNYPAKSKLSKDASSGLPFVSAGNISNGRINSKDLLFLSKEQEAKLKSGHIKAHDCLMCIRGSLGKFGFAEKDGGAIASSLVILRIKEQSLLDKDFLSIVLSSPLFSDSILARKNGTAQPNLGADVLKKFPFPLPPLAEQKRIVAKIEALFEQIDLMTK